MTEVLVWSVGFNRVPRLDDIRTGKAALRQIFGHVEMWGYTSDETWVFFDPASRGQEIHVAHRYDEVQWLLTERYARCEHILDMQPRVRHFRFPLFPPMNCATCCGALLGYRAFTPWGLRRTLLANGAQRRV